MTQVSSNLRPATSDGSSRGHDPAWLVWGRRVALGVIAVLPLAAWPGIARPFSTPKLYLLVGAVLLLGPVAWMAAVRTRKASGPGDTRTGTVREGRDDREDGEGRGAGDDAWTSRPSGPYGTSGASGASGISWTAAGDRWIRAAALCWLVSWSASALLGDIVSLDALLLGLAGGLLALILLALAPRPEALAAALVAGPTGVALVALLQWAGLDPFALAGWVAPIAGASPRLRIYGTLGNPNFVAALLTGSVPIAAGLLASLSARVTTTDVVMTTTVGSATPRPAINAGQTTAVGTTTAVVVEAGGPLHGGPRKTLRRGMLSVSLLVVALLLQLGAIGATGSRAAALGLVAAGVTALTLAVARDSRRSGVAAALAALAALVVALLVIALSPARPLGDTLAGRLYIWRVTAPHAFEAPIAGRGPGAYALLHPVWEAAARPPADHPDARFAGPQQHAHNDYLEALVDRGLAGPVTILAVLATLWAAGGRRARRAPGRPVALGAAAAVAALGAVACVDFPLARPAELALWWSALALTRQTDGGRPDPGQRGHA